jgi:starvation-inducible DNA-binding protein
MEKLIEQLKVILGTNFGLYFKAHSFHWNVEGSDFVQYHKFLGKLYEQVFNNTDLIAEKIRMLDSYAPTTLPRMLELSDVPNTENVPSALAMLSQLKQDNDRYIIHLRAGIVLADQADEPAISNFLQEILDQHQKQAWFLSSLIK